MAAGFWRRHRVLQWVLIACAGIFAAITTGLFILARHAEPLLHARIIQALEDHFHAHVELDSFHVSIGDGFLWADGKGLRIWQPVETAGKTESENEEPPAVGNPLIQIKEFRFHAPLTYESGKPIRIAMVRLSGLTIDVPPRHQFKHGYPANVGSEPSRATPAITGNLSTQSDSRPFPFVVETVDCVDSVLILETDKPGKLPMEFDIAHLTLTGVQPGQPVAYMADLTNPRPTGTIHTHGSIGPWNVPDPGETPLNGNYKFEHADLSDFKGIAGILSSDGQYQGTLRNLVVDGETTTPDFRLSRFGTAVPLYTHFHAIVDGTNGDTRLDPVDAFLDQSHFLIRGQVVRAIEKQSDGRLVPNGHNIQITMHVEHGHAQDFIRLVTTSGVPFFTGNMDLNGALQISPGNDAMQDRLKLNGTFALDEVKFASTSVQDRVSELSLRGQGDPKDVRSTDSSTVRSNMKGDFRMANGVITLPSLEYMVPGADINLNGTYGVDTGAVAFTGIARMEATVSNMVGGWKGILLKPVDHYFKKNGAGTEVPIHISGTRDNPQFGVDIKGLKTTSPQRPDEPH